MTNKQQLIDFLGWWKGLTNREKMSILADKPLINTEAIFVDKYLSQLPQPPAGISDEEILDKHIYNKFDETDRRTFLNAMNECANQRIGEYREAMQEFCDRVESGEVRSTYTYNKFKQLLNK